MKADISDAPERVIRRHHKRGGFYIVICLMVGSTATIGAFQLISRASSIDSAYKQSTRPDGHEGQLIRATGLPPDENLGGSQPQVLLDIHLPANTARQNVFNDQNYIARGADNVLTFRVGSDPSPRKELSKQVKLTIVGQSPRIKEQACRPYKQGSIESRNCRASIGLKHRN